jgi:hypothetical protein
VSQKQRFSVSECGLHPRAIDGAAEAPVYADSGYWAERDQSFNNGDDFTHYLKQAVVLFPCVERVSSFAGIAR